MQSTYSIEGYCSKPLTQHQIFDYRDHIKDADEKDLRCVLSCIVTFFVIVGGLVGLAYLEYIEKFLVVMFSVGAIIVIGIAGSAYSECVPKNSIKIMDREWATDVKGHFIEDVAAPDIERMASPLARQLLQNIAAQDRSPVRFEYELMKKLCEF